MVIVLYNTSRTTGWTGSKYLEYNPGSELNLFLLNKEQRINEQAKNQMKTTVEQWMNENRTMNKTNERQQ
jgi:hypothetical protein